jgi:hypothetical protein
MRADLFDGREVLGHCSATFEYATLYRARFSWDLTRLRYGVLRTGCHLGWIFDMIGLGGRDIDMAGLIRRILENGGSEGFKVII